jgi:hypothetical protein
MLTYRYLDTINKNTEYINLIKYIDIENPKNIDWVV